MSLTNYFIKHPVYAIVLNAMIVIVGLLSFYNLPVREFPEVDIPTLAVFTAYPNASSELVETNVTNILEEQLAGVEGLDSMTSRSRQGNSNIDLKFKEGVSAEQAMIAVRDAIGLAKVNLPKEVDEPLIMRATDDEGPPFIALSLSSTTMTGGELTHYAERTLKNAFRALTGIASVQVWGEPYTIIVSLDSEKMYGFGVNTEEVYNALIKYNQTLPTGKFRNQVPTTLELKLTNIEDFENIIVKNDPNNPIYLKSIATIENKQDKNAFRIRLNGKPAVLLAINKANDANPLEVSNQVNQLFNQLSHTLPDGMKLNIELDQAKFIHASINNIKSSIIESVVLVLLIVFLFLRSLRSTLIPLLTIPISLIGAMIFLDAFGYSINTLSLLAMVLAIGLVVDDAIVVLENIARHIEEGLSPVLAAKKGSQEIAFAIVAMTLTLASVFTPIAFIQGAIGQLFIEFAVTLASSVFVSGVVALTLSPLMCGKILTKQEKKIFPWLDVGLAKLQQSYANSLNFSFSHRRWVGVGIVVVLFACAFFIKMLPHEIAPPEDRALIGIFIPAIPGLNIDELAAKIKPVEKTAQTIQEAQSLITYMGEFGAYISIPLKENKLRSRSASEIVASLDSQLKGIPSLDAFTWNWSSGLPGLDNAVNGTELIIAVLTTADYQDLFKVTEKIRQQLGQQNIFPDIRNSLQLDTPGYRIEVDNEVMSRLAISHQQIAQIIEIFFSGIRNLSFQREGIRYPIVLQGENTPWRLDELYLTNLTGTKISLGSFAFMRPTALPKELNHHNQLRSTYLSASLPEQLSFSQGMQQFWQSISARLPDSFKFEWVGAGKAYLENSMQILLLFGMALIFIYAILSVQFENFISPFIIMFTVPLACTGALVTLWLFNQSLNIYSQIGLITLIGLITKHGILMVDFANRASLEGKTAKEAIQAAASLRLRPILMTTAAMIFGAIPFVLATGAGKEARHAIGLVIIGGLAIGTFFTLYILPAIYIFVMEYRLKQRKSFLQQESTKKQL